MVSSSSVNTMDKMTSKSFLPTKRITQIELPKKLVVTRLVDNNLYGFWKEDWDKLDYSKLIQVCLDTKEVTTLKVSDWSTNQQYNPNTYEGIWIGRTFVKNFDSYDRTLDHFFAFSLDSLQWRKLDIAFKCRGGRHPLSNNENTLVVKTVSCANKLTSFYRFNFNRPDTLVNLSRYAIKQDLLIFQDVVEHLPNKFKQPFTE
ncbi:hypothetical protein M3Y95_00901100 [Aphelenchoides besseyi]|nr:hypothetical protein M3Y95_00901100 [Aphelenchoides besseyi]